VDPCKAPVGIHQPDTRQDEGVSLRQPAGKAHLARTHLPQPESISSHRAKDMLTASASATKGDQRQPHDSGKAVTTDALARVGVLYLHAPSLSDVDALAAERGYKNRDEVKVSPQTMGDAYEEKVRNFFAEHLHEDEEIRYIRGGKGYFDVRNEGDEWVRIELEKDDLIILPPGIYHRFTTDETNVSGTL
jgi:1,2-dihydroxy-3-keto-5-methylthiopentene dioxygenase